MEYYEIRFKGHEITVYDTQDLIREICNIVHGYGIPESEIEVITHKGRNQKTLLDVVAEWDKAIEKYGYVN